MHSCQSSSPPVCVEFLSLRSRAAFFVLRSCGRFPVSRSVSLRISLSRAPKSSGCNGKLPVIFIPQARRDCRNGAIFSGTGWKKAIHRGFVIKKHLFCRSPVVCGTYPYPGSELPPYIAYSGVLLNPGAYNEMPDPSTV